MRLIDADAFKTYMRGALEQTRRCYTDGGEWAEAVTEEFCRDIDAQPTVDPERRLGRWVAVGECYVKCSECGLETTKNELRGIALFGENEPYFCPNCGADMRQKEGDA